MDAQQRAKPSDRPDARYRINRRAAFILSALFLSLGSAVGVIFFLRFTPDRRIDDLRESAARFVDAGQWRQARIQLENLIQLLPTDADALYLLGSVHLRLLQEVSEAGGPVGGDHPHLKLAVACYRRATALEPDRIVPQRWLLELDLRTGNWADARRRLRQLGRWGPDDPLVALANELVPSEHRKEVRQATRLLEERGMEAKVIALLAPLAAREPGDLDVLGPLAIALSRAGRIKERDRLLANAERIVGTTNRIELIRAQCAWWEGDVHRAGQLAQRLLAEPHLEPQARRLIATHPE